MISVLAPTRGRVMQFIRMYNSLRETAVGDVEVLVRMDDDDRATYEGIHALVPDLDITLGPRIVMSDLWNELAAKATGDIFMLGADDVVFQTKGWNKIIQDYYDSLPDKIAYVHGDDKGNGRPKEFGTHGCIHRRWYETIGYFTAQGYSADYADAWPNDVAEMLGRRVYLEFVTEHMHAVWKVKDAKGNYVRDANGHLIGKGEWDKTYQETNARLHRDQTPVKYQRELSLREADAAKLRKVLNTTYTVSEVAISA